MEFQGRDRRRHRVFITRNTEYHLRDEICVAIRDRGTKRWIRSHLALNQRLEGGVRLFSNGAAVPNIRDPEPGDAIYFNDRTSASGDRQLVTSRIVMVGRPPKVDVAQYPPS